MDYNTADLMLTFKKKVANFERGRTSLKEDSRKGWSKTVNYSKIAQYFVGR